MSRNSKNARRFRAAKEMSALHATGGKGPAKTTPKHGKTRAWWQKFASYAGYIAGGKKGASGKE